MSVELIAAPPGSGKTRVCVDKIRQTLSIYPLSIVWVITPDRGQASFFRQTMANSGGALGAYVGSFGDLYRNILERAGDFVPVASSPLLHRLVQEVVDHSVDVGELVHFASLQKAPGFILALRDAFAELKRSLIYPDQFLEFTLSRTPAQKELALLYARYQARLRDLTWADPEGLSWLAVEALRRQPEIAAPIRLVVVDGFDFFSGAQRETLKLLANQVEDLLITLPGEVASVRSAHRRFVPVIEALVRDISPRLTLLTDTPHLPADFLHLEKNVFEPVILEARTPAEPFLLEARSPADEAREALRWIKACVLRREIPLSECAIFTPNPDVYRPLLRMAAAEFGIPIHFSQGEPLNESPAVAALLNLLNLSAQNFKARSLFNALRSPYFDFDLDSRAIDVLETVSRVARIVEGRDQWDETWGRLALLGSEENPDMDDERALPGLPRGGVEVGILRDSLAGFFSRNTPPDGSLSHTGWVNWLEDLLENLHFYENANSERDQQACEILREALRALVLSDAVVGVRRVDYAQFLSDLQGTLDGVGLPDLAGVGQPTLFVGRMVEARGIRYQVVAILGLSEGFFPEVERSDPFLDEELRQALGLELRLQREQAGLFYQAVTRADQFLLITRPYLSDDGEYWEASPYWKAAKNLFDKSVVQRIRPDDLRSLTEAGSSQELLFWAVRRKGLPGRYAEFQERWESLRSARNILQARRAKDLGSPFEGAAQAVTPELAARYSANQVWSASRLEAYSTCPHMFYVKTALGLEPVGAPELGLDASQMGSMLHKILEQVYQTAANPADVDSLLAALPQVAGQVFASAPQKFGFRPSPLWEIEQAQFLAALELTLGALAEEGAGWVPFAYEQTFGIRGTPVLSVELGSGETLRLHGVIDRIDRNARGELRVVDYKTGSSHLAQGDLKDGRRLQLPLYALAARDALGLGDVADGIYWKILAAEAGSLKLAKFRTDEAQGVDGAAQVAREHLLRIVTGIRAGDFPPVPPKGGCPSYCPAAQWCWRYEPGW